MTESPNDVTLWAQARAGDAEAFARIFDRHASAVTTYCAYRNSTFREAEDLAATVFLETWRNRGRLSVSGTSILPLLFGIARNVCSHHRRSEGRRGRAHTAAAGLALTAVSQVADPGDLVCSRLDAERDAARIADALDQLGPDHREIVELCLIGCLSTSEAAASLNLPEGTVKSRLSRARARLRDLLEPDGSQAPTAGGPPAPAGRPGVRHPGRETTPHEVTSARGHDHPISLAPLEDR